MQENTPTGPSPEETKRQQELSDAAEEANHFAMHPDQLIPRVPHEAGPEVAELEKMIVLFESKYSLTELHAIVDLSPDLATSFKYADDLASPQRILDAIKTYEKHNPIYVAEYKWKISTARAIVLTPEDTKKFKIRMDAKRDIIPITEKLNNLKGNTNYERLKAECRPLQQAFGSLQGDKINHN